MMYFARVTKAFCIIGGCGCCSLKYEFIKLTSTEMRNFIIRTLDKPHCLSGVLRKAALALAPAVFVNPVIVTDQYSEPLPISSLCA